MSTPDQDRATVLSRIRIALDVTGADGAREHERDYADVGPDRQPHRLGDVGREPAQRQQRGHYPARKSAACGRSRRYVQTQGYGHCHDDEASCHIHNTIAPAPGLRGSPH